MRHRLHDLPSVCSGMLVYPFSEAGAVLARCAEVTSMLGDELTVQLAFVAGPDGTPVVLVVPTWCGLPEEGEKRVAPLLKLGTLLAGTVQRMAYGAAVRQFDPYIVNGQRTFMDTCWIPALGEASVDLFIHAMETAVSPGCAIFTHEFRGAASRVSAEATAFSLRRDHVLVEILAAFSDRSDPIEAQRHRQWTRAERENFDSIALPGGYPNLLARDDTDRAAKAYRNCERLVRAKRLYDPDDVFRSAIPIPAFQDRVD